MVAQHGQPSRESAWHRCRQQPDTGYLLQPQCAKSVGRCRRRSRPLAADGQHASLALAPQQDRCFSTGAVEVRLDHLQNEATGHSGIKGVAAAFQHPHRSLRSQPMGGGDNPMGAGDFGSGCERAHACLDNKFH